MRIFLLAVVTLALSVAAASAKSGPTKVTIAAQPTIVTYGSQTTLSGTVTSQQTGPKVTVMSESCGTTSFKTLTSVTAATGGAWSTVIQPAMRTAYQAKSKNATSPTVTVQVRPMVTLAKVGAHRFRARVLAAESFAGRIALFQRQGAVRWVTVKSVALRQLGTATSGTIVSGKTFRSGVRKGKVMRILLTQRQAGACYLRGISNTLTT
jgi:hypothetical protein